MSREALDSGKPVRFSTTIGNVNRTVGTMLGHELTKAYGGQGLPDGTIDITFDGSAGNSFGAFVPKGITLRVYGDANDYVGKGYPVAGLWCGRRMTRRRIMSPRTTSSGAM